MQGRGHRFASLWRLTLTDGTTLRFTDHAQSLTFAGDAYSPMSVADVSAHRAEQGLRERNLQFIGYLTADEINFNDLRTGSYNGAEVVEFLVDWKYPWQGAFYTNTYFITEVSWTGETWEAQIDGLTTKLRQAKGLVVTRQCRHVLGDAGCGVDIASHAVTGEVTAVDEQRKQVQTDLTAYATGYFTDGLLTWTSGNNDGLSMEVESFVSTDGVVVFALPLDFDIAVADEFSITPGCSKTLDDCKGTSGDGGRPWTTNVANFGGFPHVPGTTTTLQTPNAK